MRELVPGMRELCLSPDAWHCLQNLTNHEPRASVSPVPFLSPLVNTPLVLFVKTPSSFLLFPPSSFLVLHQPILSSLFNGWGHSEKDKSMATPVEAPHTRTTGMPTYTPAHYYTGLTPPYSVNTSGVISLAPRPLPGAHRPLPGAYDAPEVYSLS